MEKTIYRRKRPSELTKEQRQAKLVKDKEYEETVANLSTPFYQKKRSEGVTPEEEAIYQQAKTQLWDKYFQWAITDGGLYEEITLEQQELEMMGGLIESLKRLNDVRGHLGKKPLELKEKAGGK